MKGLLGDKCEIRVVNGLKRVKTATWTFKWLPPASQRRCVVISKFVCCSPTEETSRKLTVDEMYLVDSGGQYL